MTLKIYPASSWRNKQYDDDVIAMRSAGHSVYSFREANSSFCWSCRTSQEYIRQLETDPLVAEAFDRDKNALDWCEVCVLILPCGPSAHLEAMYASSIGKPVIVKLDPAELRLDLMYKLLAIGGGVRFVTNIAELCTALLRFERNRCTTIGDATAMPIKNSRIRDLAEHAWTLSNSDLVRAIEILRELTGLSFDAAFTAIDDVRPPESTALVDQPDFEPL
jgi:hypothetical protein